MFEFFSSFIIFDKITISQIFSALGSVIAFLGAAITAYLYYKKNDLHKKELIQKEDHNNRNIELSVFIDATKLLTEGSDRENDSTIIAKISAMYLLYDIAIQNPNYIERTLQILNMYVSPLIRFIEKETETSKFSDCNNPLRINSINQKKIIKEWQYKGSRDEVIVSNTLFITRKIITDCFYKTEERIDLSNTIIFDLDLKKTNKINKTLKLDNKYPIENLIFYHCKLNNTNFKNLNFHFCKFINCFLDDVDFSNGNLWGLTIY